MDAILDFQGGGYDNPIVGNTDGITVGTNVSVITHDGATVSLAAGTYTTIKKDGTTE